MNRRLLIKTAIISTSMVLAASCTAVSNRVAKKPNVIFILTDDQGWGDLSCAGHPYMRTPNLDRLAEEGTRFTQFYVNATVCAPSRVSLMTGRFPA